MYYSGDYAVSAGASGAVFAVIGGLLWIVIRHRGHYETLTTRGLLFMIALCLYYGISTAGIDNWSHLGGLASGFVLCVILYGTKPKHVDLDEENQYT
jgi:rhomboid protease GluP